MAHSSHSSTKLPGKTEFAGRRRAPTRRAGFNAHADTTGGEFQRMAVPVHRLAAGGSLNIRLLLPAGGGAFVGFGGWFAFTDGISVEVAGLDGIRYVDARAPWPNWSKLGGMWPASDVDREVSVTFSAPEDGAGADIAVYEFASGIITHQHLEGARDALLRNMWSFSPEANFYSSRLEPKTLVSGETKLLETSIILKSCNRCARYLPINTEDERQQLSFSNHCVAEHRTPCRHATFGRLTDSATGEVLKLHHGYQLECRFCKKFEVNAAHNPQRSVAQMKEDGARRRHFELLLTELYGGSPQLRFRAANGGAELGPSIWEKFGRKCFNCETLIATGREMNLDHTRPLALLWPLDGTATCLCKNCNSEKRDKSPIDFYGDGPKLAALSQLTGISLEELRNPTPNLEALRLLQGRLGWLFADFLTRADLVKVRDGKRTSDLVVKALEKVMARAVVTERFALKPPATPTD
jgi:hypothetical protein